jgi:hypothetical protein
MPLSNSKKESRILSAYGIFSPPVKNVKSPAPTKGSILISFLV